MLLFIQPGLLELIKLLLRLSFFIFNQQYGSSFFCYTKSPQIKNILKKIAQQKIEETTLKVYLLGLLDLFQVCADVYRGNIRGEKLTGLFYL